MFVNNEITDRGLLHKLLSRAATETTMDERASWARAADAAVKDATRPSTFVRMRLTRPAVVMAAAPALSAIAATLRDEHVVVSHEALAAIRAFLTDGIDSPLYGNDPLASGRGAEELRRFVLSGTFAAGRSRELAHAGAA